MNSITTPSRLQKYGGTFNRYDLLKCIALLSMVADHISFYLLPDYYWPRVIGRVAAPIFMFLVGYSMKTKNTPDIYLGCLALVAADAAALRPIFPINILASIIITRWVMRGVIKHFEQEAFVNGFVIACLIWLLPMGFLTEYGTQAFLFAAAGYSVRVRRHLWLTALAFIIFAALMWHDFHFNLPQGILMLLLLAWAYRLCITFTAQSVTLPSAWLTWWGLRLSRYALWFYVLHIVFFILLETFIYPDAHQHFSWL